MASKGALKCGEMEKQVWNDINFGKIVRDHLLNENPMYLCKNCGSQAIKSIKQGQDSYICKICNRKDQQMDNNIAK